MKPEVAKLLARRYEGLQNIVVSRIVKACDRPESLALRNSLLSYVESVKVCQKRPESDVAAEYCDETLKILANEMANECIWEI